MDMFDSADPDAGASCFFLSLKISSGFLFMIQCLAVGCHTFFVLFGCLTWTRLDMNSTTNSSGMSSYSNSSSEASNTTASTSYESSGSLGAALVFDSAYVLFLARIQCGQTLDPGQCSTRNVVGKHGVLFCAISSWSRVFNTNKTCSFAFLLYLSCPGHRFPMYDCRNGHRLCRAQSFLSICVT